MKSILRILLVQLLLLATSIPMMAQDTTAVEEFTVLTIEGEITHKTEKLASVLVELYEQNKMVDAFETKKNGKFKFFLYNNHIYTIQLTKEGYNTKKVTVNTWIPNDFEDEISYEFDLELDELNTILQDEKETLLEYPTAIISFDETRGEFIFNKEYTKGLMEDLKED
ncbi:MAG: hypothetical protein NWR97_11670 [Salibacteraceae bacterium]|nr:hypothetical protein [Salibacteraceae bacterium]